MSKNIDRNLKSNLFILYNILPDLFLESTNYVLDYSCCSCFTKKTGVI